MPTEQLPVAKRLLLPVLERAGVAAQAVDANARVRHLRDRDARRRNGAFHAPDGLPMPPAHLVHKVVGHFDYEAFYEGGRTRHAYLWEILENGGGRPAELRAVLDWGCGCGRVLRHWNRDDGLQIYGSDYNAVLVDWCREAFPFARLSTNGLAPPLPFPDHSFDFLYGISILTHLDEPLQVPWIDELARVVRPGGHILVTMNGVVGSQTLDPADRARYDGGQVLVFGDRFQGRNYCAVLHPESYVRDVLARDLELVFVVPAADPEYDHGQDAYLLRVPT